MRITPYLSYDGTAREAMEFYRSVLGGELKVITFGEGGALPADSENAGKVMHAELVAAHGERLYASDWLPEVCGGAPFEAGSDITLTLEGGQEDAEALRAAFTALGEGGQVFMPLGRQDWGDEFGSLKDKFGKGWNIAISGAAAQ